MSSELRVDRIIPTDGVPTGGGGSIIQIKMGTLTSVFNTTSTTMVDTGLSVSITPKFSTSKILVNVSLGSFANSGSFKRAFMNIVRDSTTIIVGDARTGHEVTAAVAPRARDDNYVQIPLSFMVMDSPATTSSVTYKVQATRGSDSGTVYLYGNQGADAYSGNTASTITVMEVSA